MRGSNEMKKSIGVNHCIANCLDCDWSAQNYKNAQAIAAIHAKKYRHKVNGDVGIGFTYDGR